LESETEALIALLKQDTGAFFFLVHAGTGFGFPPTAAGKVFNANTTTLQPDLFENNFLFFPYRAHELALTTPCALHCIALVLSAIAKPSFRAPTIIFFSQSPSVSSPSNQLSLFTLPRTRHPTTPGQPGT
jgi:hypothetical protein